MQIDTSYELIRLGDRTMRTFVATPVNPINPAPVKYPGIVFYSDIFQLTPSTIRWVSRLASYGYTVVAPEIYYRIEAPGTVLEFDDAGKVRGQADVEALTAAQFDEDIRLTLDWMAQHPRIDAGRIGVAGHCTGGHIGFRAAVNPTVKATALWYPTGLHNGKLGADPDSGSLALLDQIHNPMFFVFGARDPHTPAESLVTVRAALASSNVDYEWLLVDGEHAFGRDIGPRWDPQATDTAFAATIEFLHNIL